MRPHRHSNLACMRDIFGFCCRLIWPFIELVRVRVLPFRRLEVKIHTHGSAAAAQKKRSWNKRNKLLEISNLLFFWIIYRAIFHTIFFLINFFSVSEEKWKIIEQNYVKTVLSFRSWNALNFIRFHFSRSSCTLLLCSEAAARNLPQLPSDCHNFDYWYLINEVEMLLLHHEAERWFALTML